MWSSTGSPASPRPSPWSGLGCGLGFGFGIGFGFGLGASPVTLKSPGSIFGKSVRYLVVTWLGLGLGVGLGLGNPNPNPNPNLIVTSSRPGRRLGEKKLPQKVSSLSSAGTTSGCCIKYLYSEVVPALVRLGVGLGLGLG